MLMNPPGMITYVDCKTGKPSCLDLCLVSPRLAPDTEVSQGTDMGSDHCPVNVVLNCQPNRCPQAFIKRWKTKGVNWNQWSKEIPNRTLYYPMMQNQLQKILLIDLI